MSEQAHDRQSFEAQGSAFLRQNISEKPEFDYAENRPPHSAKLAGRMLTLALRDADVRYRHTFTPDEVTVEVLGPEAERRPIVTAYEAFEMAPDIFFVSYLVDDFDSVAMALDLAKGTATAVMGEMTEVGIISRVGSSRVEEGAGSGDGEGRMV
jgi:hypothetical protein